MNSRAACASRCGPRGGKVGESGLLRPAVQGTGTGVPATWGSLLYHSLLGRDVPARKQFSVCGCAWGSVRPLAHLHPLGPWLPPAGTTTAAHTECSPHLQTEAYPHSQPLFTPFRSHRSTNTYIQTWACIHTRTHMPRPTCTHTPVRTHRHMHTRPAASPATIPQGHAACPSSCPHSCPEAPAHDVCPPHPWSALTCKS